MQLATRKPQRTGNSPTARRDLGDCTSHSSDDQRAALENDAMLTVRRGIEEPPVADHEQGLTERYHMVLEALGT